MRVNQRSSNSLVGQLVGDLAAGYSGVMVSIGNHLGFYQAMAGAGPLNSHEVARRSGCAERYVREWLNSQVAARYMDYHPASKTYELTPEQAVILADDTSPFFLPNAWNVVASMWEDEPKALQAFKTGEGVAWGEHSERLFCGVAAFYRNGYAASLVQEWLPALTGVTAKLEKGAKVADVGCGHGHSTVLMAKAFPKSRFWGFDVHSGSIEIARKVAHQTGVEDRVRFEVAKADGYDRRGYDLICFFDCLHDMGRPVEAARYAAEALAQDGTIMLVEPYAGEASRTTSTRSGGSTTPLRRQCAARMPSRRTARTYSARRRASASSKSVLRWAGLGTVRKAAQTSFNLILEARP